MKLLSLLLVLGTVAAPGWADPPRTVTVTGVGRVEALPDKASLTYTVIDEGNMQVSVSSLVDKNRKRVDPSVQYLKGVVGKEGTVTALPRVQRRYEYDETLRKNVLRGYQVTTTIQVELQGRDAIEQKLGKLFDTSNIKADEIREPVLGLTTKTEADAKRDAYKLAVQSAVDEATAQLEPGENLGQALQRGTRVEVPSPYVYEKAARLAAADAAPGGAGQAMIETGKIQVHAVTNFIFEVTGKATRLLTGKDLKEIGK